MVDLASKGDAASLPKLGEAIQHHRERDGEIVNSASLDSSGTLAKRLGESSSLQLAALQQAVEEPPADVSPALTEAFNASAKEHGKAMEAAIGRTSTLQGGD